MKIKKILASMLAVILIITALPGTALAATNMAPKWASGYYPTGATTPNKYYSCYLGGTDRRVNADITYGTNTSVFINASIKTLIVSSGKYQYITRSSSGIGSAALEYSTVGSTILVAAATATYRIVGSTVAELTIM